MTARYVALIRGLNNIGAARRVAMADLRVLFEGLGFRDVRTLLNSGNVIFSAANNGRGEILARIEKGLASKLGLTSPVTVLSGQEVAAAVRNNPLFTRLNEPVSFACGGAADGVGPGPAAATPQGTVGAGGACSATVLRTSGAQTALRRVHFGLRLTARLNDRARPETWPRSRRSWPCLKDNRRDELA